VKVNYSPKERVMVTDLETGERIGRFGPSDAVLPVRLQGNRRCRILLLEPTAGN